MQSGLGYQFIKFFSTAAGVDNPQNDGFVSFRTHWKLEFLNDNVEITDMFNFVNSFLYLRTRDPETRSDGTVPKKNDYQIVVSLAIKIN